MVALDVFVFEFPPVHAQEFPKRGQLSAQIRHSPVAAPVGSQNPPSLLAGLLDGLVGDIGHGPLAVAPEQPVGVLQLGEDVVDSV